MRTLIASVLSAIGGVLLTVALLHLPSGTFASVAARTAARLPAQDQTVRDYNDGFTDSKIDDCQQGFRPACTWLHPATSPKGIR